MTNDLKIGDIVEYTNGNGVKFFPRIVTGFRKPNPPDFLPENVVYINSDSPWYPVKPSRLKKVNSTTE